MAEHEDGSTEGQVLGPEDLIKAFTRVSVCALLCVGFLYLGVFLAVIFVSLLGSVVIVRFFCLSLFCVCISFVRVVLLL